MTADKKPLPTTFSEVIALWPRPVAFGRMVNPANPNLARGWGTRNTIPEAYWLATQEAAAKCGYPEVTYALLSTFKPGK